MIEARYYDGLTAQGQAATVAVVGPGIQFTLTETQETFHVLLSDLVVTKGANLVVVSFDDRSLEFWPEAWTELALPAAETKKTRAALILAPLALTLLSLLYFYHRPLIKAIAELLPESFLEHTSHVVVAGYEKDSCPKALPAVQEIFGRLGENFSDYRVVVVKSPILNAFALPGKVIIITSELLRFVTSPEALAGIIAHEIVHIRERHVHRMYVAQILVDSFWQLTLGQGIGLPLNELAKGFYSQGEEREADLLAAEMLRDQGISPEGMRDFFRDLEKKETALEKYLGFSHPAYPERIQIFSKAYEATPVLGPELWKELKAACE